MTERQTLRDRLKHQTRSHIAATAEQLFAEHGFREVTVDAVAEAAGVSRQTVFNHFPVKEDLVFDRGREFEAQMVAAIRERPPGTGVVDAFRAAHLEFWSRLYANPAPRPPGTFFYLVDASPALQAYARELTSRAGCALAAEITLVAPEAGDDLRARVIADALLAVYAATFDAVKRHMVAGESPEAFLGAILEQAGVAFDLLAAGLGAFQ